MATTRTPIAATPAFDLDALKLHARIDGTDDDDSLELMGRTATAEIEAYCDIALLDTQIRYTFEADGKPGTVVLPIGPLRTTSGIAVNGLPVPPGAVTIGRYPSISLPEHDAGPTAITYVAGWGDAVEDIPPDLQFAILDHAAMLYDARAADDVKQGLSVAASRICARHRQVRT